MGSRYSVQLGLVAELKTPRTVENHAFLKLVPVLRNGLGLGVQVVDMHRLIPYDCLQVTITI
jgi:hypothetical protein